MGARQAAREESAFELEDIDVARILGWARVLIGVGLFLSPRQSSRFWTGHATESWIGKMSIKQIGGREIAIGAGLLRALERGEPLRPWLAASAASDATDVLAVLGAWRQMRPLQRWTFLLGAAGATALGTKLALELE